MDIEKQLLDGFPIIINNHITKSIRRRKHKKKRVDKKWRKRYGYKEIRDDTKIYVSGGKLFMSQKCFDELMKKI